MDQRADGAMVVGGVFTAGWTGRRSEVVGRWRRAGERARAHGRRRDAFEMHVAERNRELERQRKTAPDTPPISKATGTSSSSSRSTGLMPRQNHSAGTLESSVTV